MNRKNKVYIGRRVVSPRADVSCIKIILTACGGDNPKIEKQISILIENKSRYVDEVEQNYNKIIKMSESSLFLFRRLLTVESSKAVYSSILVSKLFASSLENSPLTTDSASFRDEFCSFSYFSSSWRIRSVMLLVFSFLASIVESCKKTWENDEKNKSLGYFWLQFYANGTFLWFPL